MKVENRIMYHIHIKDMFDDIWKVGNKNTKEYGIVEDYIINIKESLNKYENVYENLIIKENRK